TDLAATTPATAVTVTRYGRRTTTVAVHHQRCLWRGVFGAHPVRVLVIVEPRRPSLGQVAPAHCCAGAPSGPYKRVPTHTAQASHEGGSGSLLLHHGAHRRPDGMFHPGAGGVYKVRSSIA